MPFRQMAPPTKRKTVEAMVSNGREGPSGVKWRRSTAVGTTCTSSGASPDAIHDRRADSDGVHTSSTTRFARSTQADGTAPYSQGWYRTNGPSLGASKLGGHCCATPTAG